MRYPRILSRDHVSAGSFSGSTSQVASPLPTQRTAGARASQLHLSTRQVGLLWKQLTQSLAAVEDRRWWYQERRALLGRQFRRLAPGRALDIGTS